MAASSSSSAVRSSSMMQAKIRITSWTPNGAARCSALPRSMRHARCSGPCCRPRQRARNQRRADWPRPH